MFNVYCIIRASTIVVSYGVTLHVLLQLRHVRATAIARSGFSGVGVRRAEDRWTRARFEAAHVRSLLRFVDVIPESVDQVLLLVNHHVPRKVQTGVSWNVYKNMKI